jgi:hypothetical protein
MTKDDRTNEMVITRCTKGRGRGLLWNYEVRDANGGLVCVGGPVSKSLAQHNAEVLGAVIVTTFTVR